MTDLPFGFSAGDDDERKGRGGSGDGPGGANPFGFGAGFGQGGAGFDPAALGQMFSQLGEMFSNAGTVDGGGGVNYDLAKKIATQSIGFVVPPSAATTSAITDSVRLAETWLDGVTTLPAGVTTTSAWTPATWLDESISTWQRLCDPVAAQLTTMWSDALPDEAREMAGPLMGVVSQMSGMAFGSQLGQALGQLSREVLTSTDIGLPLGPVGHAALLPDAIEQFSKGLDQPNSEILMFLAAREAAHHRLFSHVPWLRARLLSRVEEYARGIKVDMSAITEAAQGFDPSSLTDPSALEELLSQNSFEPQNTPEQLATLERLETLLALIEGWVTTVVSEALGNRIPSTGALSETLRRRRATGGPAEQTFATLIGLELRPRKVREAEAVWSALESAGGVDARDGVWSHPDLLPTADDLDNPSAFVDRTVPTSDSATFDPLAELEKTIARERENKKTDESDSEE